MGIDSKYVVFKREELLAVFPEYHVGTFEQDAILSVSLDDAVVIRTQDAFAGPALHAYAANIALAAAILASDGTSEHRAKAAELMQIGDYFHVRAVEADEQALKLPD